MPDPIRPHASDTLTPLLLEGARRDAELQRAAKLPRWTMSSRETGDAIMLGNGGFTPLAGFMTRADWDTVCRDMYTSQGVFWPIPVTLSVSGECARNSPVPRSRSPTMAWAPTADEIVSGTTIATGARRYTASM